MARQYLWRLEKNPYWSRPLEKILMSFPPTNIVYACSHHTWDQNKSLLSNNHSNNILYGIYSSNPIFDTAHPNMK